MPRLESHDTSTEESPRDRAARDVGLGGCFPGFHLSSSKLVTSNGCPRVHGGRGLGVLNTVLFERMEELRNGSRRRPLGRQVMLTALVFVGSLAVGVLVVSIDWSGALSVGDAVPAIWLAAFASMLVAGLLNLGPRVNSEGR
jgi:hypothetical protein